MENTLEFKKFTDLEKKVKDLEAQVDLLTEQKKDALEVANKLRAEVASLNRANYQSHKKSLKYKWESEMREGKFISSQKVVFELRKHLEDVQEQLSSVTIK